MVNLYNQKGWKALRNDPYLIEVSESEDILPQRIRDTTAQISTIIFQNKGHNQGDYLVLALDPNFKGSSLWLFPKKIASRQIPIIESLFIMQGRGQDYCQFKLIRPALLSSDNFDSHINQEWEVKII